MSNDDAADVNFSVVSATTNQRGNITNQFNSQNVDLQGEAQQVPFEAETSFGLIAVAGFFGYRKFRQYKAKRNNDSVAA
ncbi:MAG: hypothetical protein ABEI32_10270 [Halothece sp.]